MEDNHKEWLDFLPEELFKGVEGNFLDSYAVALEGWRRGLSLRWYAKDHDSFKSMKTWFVDEPGQLFSLSNGKKTHYFFRTRGDLVSNEAVEIAKNKQKTRDYLHAARINTPEGRAFNINEKSNILKYVNEIGYPVVLKPLDGSFGRGVITNIKNDEAITNALKYLKESLSEEEIIVERYIPGQEYRLYVVGDEVVAAINREPANIIGDGISNISQLIKEKNETRKKNPRLINCLIKVDREVEERLVSINIDLDTVLKKGEKLYLREKSNISMG